MDMAPYPFEGAAREPATRVYNRDAATGLAPNGIPDPMTATGTRLIVIAGPSRGQVIAVDRTVSIGRDQSSSVVIPDLALSRRHCTIAPSADGVVLSDLESRNGTIVNGVPIRAQALKDGDQIRIGDSALIFVAAEPAAPPAGEAVVEGSTVAAPIVVDDATPGAMRFTSELTIEHDLIGQSPPMLEIYRRIARAAPTDSTVLVRGESGTGKELVARAIHANSARARGPFVAINCAAVPEGLMESELFGHERGAFTGAVAQKRGRIETAHGGTAFFDEIGELPLALQAKLLRVLQERQVERVGGTRAFPVDIRVVAATNRDLDAAVKDGTFRQDLFYRLNVIALPVAPLRHRNGDLPLLITYFVRRHASRCGRKVRGVTREARVRLLEYDWPGNVRELENAIERAIVMSTGEWIEEDDLPEHLLEAPSRDEPADEGYHGGVNRAKRDLIARALERSGGNVAKAARLLSLQPTYLHRLIRNLGLKDEQ
jgi:DNA-binding NtrC family response regulator